MEASIDEIQNHYHRPNLYEIITRQLEKQNIDLKQVGRRDLSAVDEFHVRGAVVSEELAASIDLKNRNVLDIGCGIGGPCRMLADQFNCQVTGIDLSPEYIRTAKKLSELVQLDHKTTFIQGNALDLPFRKHTFDAVWTQHVQMNVSDKKRFYAEIARVLKPGGSFLYYEILKKGTSTLDFPVPWSNRPEFSFLFRSSEMHSLLENLDMKKIKTTDQTVAGIEFFEKMLARIQVHGPPLIGLNLLMGESTLLKISNLLKGLKEKALQLESGIYVKPDLN